jgi:hypothetical protein
VFCGPIPFSPPFASRNSERACVIALRECRYRDVVERLLWFRIELNNATVASCRIQSWEKSVNTGIAACFSGYHLITLSARASTLGGIVRPICFAAFRLMMNSNFCGCSTGKSAGFAPFKILSTYVAARRSKSSTLTP